MRGLSICFLYILALSAPLIAVAEDTGHHFGFKDREVRRAGTWDRAIDSYKQDQKEIKGQKQRNEREQRGMLSESYLNGLMSEIQKSSPKTVAPAPQQRVLPKPKSGIAEPRSGKNVQRTVFPRPTISVLISGTPRSHFSEALREVIDLYAKGKKIDEVKVVLPKHDFASLVQFSRNMFSKDTLKSIARNYTNGEPGNDMNLEILPVSKKESDALLVQSSPAWIIKNQEGEHVFEGFSSIHSFLAEDGTLATSSIVREEKRGTDGLTRYYYGRKNSGVRFPADSGARFTDTFPLTEERIKRAAKRIIPKLPEKIARSTTTPNLPACKTSQTRKQETHGYSANTELLRTLYYDGRNRKQQKLALPFGSRAVPYFAGVNVLQQQAKELDPRIFSAPTLGIRCLPTSMEIEKNGIESKAIVYHEGKAAFQNMPRFER